MKHWAAYCRALLQCLGMMGLLLLPACDGRPAGYTPTEANPRVFRQEKSPWYTVLVARDLDSIIGTVDQLLGRPLKDINAVRVFLITDADRFESLTGENRLAGSGLHGNDIYLLGPFNESDQVRHALEMQLIRLTIYQNAGFVNAHWMIPDWFVTGFSLMKSEGGASQEWVKTEDAIQWMRWGTVIKPVVFRGMGVERKLRPVSMTQAMFNTQSRLFVEYLANKKPVALQQVLAGIFRGEDFGLLWTQYYGQTAMQLWEDYLEDICRGRALPNQGWCHDRRSVLPAN